MGETLHGRAFELDHMHGWAPRRLSPAGAGYLDRLIADLKPVAAPPPPTLADLNALLTRLRPEPHLLLAHPDRVEHLEREVNLAGLPVKVRAWSWLPEDTAYLVAPPPPLPRPVLFDIQPQPEPLSLTARCRLMTPYAITPMALDFWPYHAVAVAHTTPDPARKARVRRIRATYDRRRRARQRRRRR